MNGVDELFDVTTSLYYVHSIVNHTRTLPHTQVTLIITPTATKTTAATTIIIVLSMHAYSVIDDRNFKKNVTALLRA